MMLRVTASFSYLWLLLAIPMAVMAQESNNTNPAILDVAGQPLMFGAEYYILPDTQNASGGPAAGGGGLTLLERNGPCPLYVGQENSVESTGLPVIFTPFVADETIIREGADFTVQFSAATICVQSTLWELGETDPSTNSVFIRTGNDGVYVRIEREGNSHKLYYCPTTTCSFCKFNCGNVTVVTENGKRLLALYGPSFPVVFRRV